MRSTSQNHQMRREALRRRLLDLISTHPTTAVLEQQIETLLDTYVVEAPGTDQLSDERRVVVTGLGVVTPLGSRVGDFWNGLVEGRSGASRLELKDADDIPCKVAAQVQDFNPRDVMDTKEARRVSRGSQFAVAAASMALNDSGLLIDESNCYDVGALIANGSTSPPDTEAMTWTAYQRGFSRINPFYITASLPNMPSCQVAIQFGLKGHNTAISTACAASSQAIGEAAEVIRRGDAAVMLAGGTEAPICRLTLASFCAVRALSTRNNDPERASRPFDATRDGFVIAEGSGVLVLESLDHARRRGAKIYAELISYAASCDAFHVTAPHPDGDGAARAMSRALEKAGLLPQQVDYLNAHATSTPNGDVVETMAIKRVFGDYAYRLPISSSKSMLGHLTSAAGAVEAAATILALKHGVIPPTINYEYPDPHCDLDYVPNQARRAPIQIAMSNSFGFGGVNGVLIFRRF